MELARARDRASDAAFIVNYTAKALESGWKVADIERELRARAQLASDERDKYDQHMLHQLEARGKEVSKATYTRVNSHFISPAALDAFELPREWDRPRHQDVADADDDDADGLLVYAPLSTELELRLRRWTETQALGHERAAQRLRREHLRTLRRARAEDVGRHHPPQTAGEDEDATTAVAGGGNALADPGEKGKGTDKAQRARSHTRSVLRMTCRRRRLYGRISDILIRGRG